MCACKQSSVLSGRGSVNALAQTCRGNGVDAHHLDYLVRGGDGGETSRDWASRCFFHTRGRGVRPGLLSTRYSGKIGQHTDNFNIYSSISRATEVRRVGFLVQTMAGPELT